MTFHKYKKIRILGHNDNKDIFLHPDDIIVEQEKVDGANFRYMIGNDRIIFGSRTQELHDNGSHEYQKNFNRCIQYIAEKMKNIKPEHKGLLFYGENCIKHSLSYDWDKIPPFLGFDILDIEEEEFLSYEEVKTIYDSYDIPMVPLIKICKASEVGEINDASVPISEYASKLDPNMKAEGVVFKNTNRQLYAKYVTDKFKEVNADTFGGTPKYGVGETAKLVLKYCTNARIDKHIFKLIDEDVPLDMPMMKYLPTAVFRDIWEEHWEDMIINHKYVIDVGDFKKSVTKRCLAVLRQVITNQALVN